MTEVRVRNVESWVVEWHRQQAKLNGKSLEAELRNVLTQAALAKKQALAEEFRSLRDELRQKHGSFSRFGSIDSRRSG